MRIYFSGGRGLTCTPEALAANRNPHIMLTFHDIESNGTLDRLNAHLAQHDHRIVIPKGKDPKKVLSTFPPDLRSKSLFMDSGAYSLYGLHVGETRGKKGGEGWLNPNTGTATLDRKNHVSGWSHRCAATARTYRAEGMQDDPPMLAHRLLSG